MAAHAAAEWHLPGGAEAAPPGRHGRRQLLQGQCREERGRRHLGQDGPRAASRLRLPGQHRAEQQLWVSTAPPKSPAKPSIPKERPVQL